MSAPVVPPQISPKSSPGSPSTSFAHPARPAFPAPWDIFQSLWKHPSLIYTMAKRDVAGRYRGSAFGMLWSLFNPMFTLTIYTVVFRYIFGARWGAPAAANTGADPAGAADANVQQYAIIIFSGMLVFLFFSECMTRAPSLILQHANYVKRVVFPLEILPWVALFSALFHTCVNIFVLLMASLFINHAIPWTFIFFPLPLLSFSLLVLGFTWFLASLGVFFRDMIPTVAMLTNIVMFLSPVFYDPESQKQHHIIYMLLYLNPLTFIIGQMRDALVWGRPPNIPGLLLYALISAAFAWLGFLWFQKMRKGFADVI